MLFKDEKLQHRFDLYGYVVVPFLDADAVDRLRSFFFETHPDVPPGFYSSSFNTDPAHKAAVNDKIESIVGPVASTLFHDIKKLGSCYLTKKPGAEGEMPIHQDWTVVDEPAHQSVTIWIPLQDTDAQNGAMQVIDGSHHFSDALRSPSLPAPFGQAVEQDMRRDLRLVPLQAGQALIFSQALLHASPANLGTSPRLAVTYGLIESDAQLMFYHAADGQVEQYYVGTDFFQQYNTQIGQRPAAGQLHRTFAYTPSQVSPQEYQHMKQKFLHQKAEEMYKMKPIFKDKDKQAFFEREGYAVFPLLDAAEVADLKTYYESKHLKDERGYGFHVSMDNTDKALCREIREKVWSVAVPRLAEHLDSFKPFVASYVVKEHNPKGVVPAHQDWSFAAGEEGGNCSITCWIALVDTDIDNGGMGVIRGSHKFMQNHRPSPSPQCPVPLSEHMFSIFPYLHTIDVKAGEVLMFDNRTFHASPPNISGAVRLAVGVGVTQADAPLVHYYMRPDGEFKTMLRYNVDEDFFLKYDNAALSRLYDQKGLIEGYGEPVEVPYEFTKYTSDELIEVIKAAGNTFNIPMTEKLAKIFGNISAPAQQEAPVQQEPEPVAAEVREEPQPEYKWIDNRTFAEKYTLRNIAREIKMRLVGS